MARKKVRQHACPNCRFEFSANSEHINFCPNCGQENHDPRFPLVHYAYEILESFLHFDTKFLYSFKTLLTRPGKMTDDYIHNIRGRYTPPFRLFIFISIFALIVISIFEKNLARSGYFGSYSSTDVERNLTIGEMFDRSADSIKDDILVPPFSWVMKNPEVTNKELRDLKRIPKDSIGEWLVKQGYGVDPLTRFFAINKKLRISRRMTVPEVTVMVSGIFKWVFLIMIPLNAFFLFVLFHRKRLLYYDTLLYSIHFTSFFLIQYSLMLLELLWLLGRHNEVLYVLLLVNMAALVVYLFVSLKKVFRFGWFGTGWRAVVLFLIAFSAYQLLQYGISLESGQ